LARYPREINENNESEAFEISQRKCIMRKKERYMGKFLNKGQSINEKK